MLAETTEHVFARMDSHAVRCPPRATAVAPTSSRLGTVHGRDSFGGVLTTDISRSVEHT
jgi:hypothetical protein